MIYVLFAVFMGFVGSVIFKDGLFANALSTTVVFLLAIPRKRQKKLQGGSSGW